MIAPFTALFARTMRLDTRAFSTHGSRLALGALVLLTLMSTASFSSRFGAAGLHLLSSLSYWSAAFITLAGISLFCSAIAEEKEEQTIGLLRMAGLRPLAILLAKSGARLLDVLMLFGVLLPFALLAVTLGGVSATQVLACAVALCAYIILLGSLGMLMSVVRPTTQSASKWMVVALIATQLLPPMFARTPGCRELFEASVWYRLSEILSTGYAAGLTGLQTWASLGVGLAAFLLAWWLFERCVRDEDAQAPDRLAVRGTSRMRLFGMARPAAGIAAVVWKDFHFACGGRAMMLIKPLVLIAAIAAFVVFTGTFGGNTEARFVGAVTQVIALLFLVFEFGMHLSRVFAQELRWQTLTSLLGLPYDATALAYAKLRAACWALLPGLGVLGIGVAIAPEGFVKGTEEVLSNWFGWVMIFTVVFFWHLCAFYSLLLRRGALSAAIGTVFAVYFMFMMMISLLAFAGGMHSEEVPAMLLIGVLGVLSVLMHMNIAKLMIAKGAR